ncbi:hypothetical protein [Nonomuraea sp. NEAU-A123]|uniref:hypothetical protein n=1 Tax=Nonomuraea sp. NEAU-A123 TaxID=2839649 RepID=UPI001BE4CCD8|nr:hypothetical protein [Nonomuraea sp. NEAU-A123]MBT2233466.1 hypothetical protein [Nonomuraea sp. NEAU-A123]
MTLTDFPEHRRVALLFRHALARDYAGVEELVAAHADRPCPWHWSSDATRWVAVRGSDGRYHLCEDAEVLCRGSISVT